MERFACTMIVITIMKNIIIIIILTFPTIGAGIYDYIRNKPGSHLRKINKELTLAMGDTQYHLRNLEKSGVVKSKRIGIYKVYYTVSILEGREESILATLQQETPREIVIHILEHPGATQSEIAIIWVSLHQRSIGTCRI